MQSTHRQGNIDTGERREMDGKGSWRSEARKIPSRGGAIGLRRGKGSIFTEIGGKGERMGWDR